jgi:cysteinyl-tRNA synthetase, unknown class
MFYPLLSILLTVAFTVNAADLPASFAYVLQAEKLGARPQALKKLAESGRQWLILDQAYKGESESRWTRSELELLRAAQPGRLILCYLSIGEAEIYRSYWQAQWQAEPPAWLDEENPDWPGNFRVKYWHPEWQQMILEQITAVQPYSGFDGYYWDIVDGFEQWEKGDAGRLNPETGHSYRADMAQWIALLKKHVSKLCEEPLLVAQNGAQLLENEVFKESITHMAFEGMFYDSQRPEPDPDAMAMLTLLKASGKQALCIEYIKQPVRRQRMQQIANENGLRLLFTDRALKTLGESQ